jgi:hypothetical protein
VANKCIFTVNKHEKADLWASFEKSTPSRNTCPALSYLIGRIGPIFSQKCHFLDFPLIFVYGFLDFWCFLKIQKADSA